MKPARAPRESPPPARWVRSRHGIYARLVGPLSRRDELGRKLYRLEFLEEPRTVGDQEWTVDELTAAGVRWLHSRPRIPGRKKNRR